MFHLQKTIRRALAEDVGWGDITSNSVVEKDQNVVAEITSRQQGILAGLEAARQAFVLTDQLIDLESDFIEGDSIAEGDVIAEVCGPGRGVLTAERVALNFLQRLSGIATATSRAVKSVADTDTEIIDTRKTTPGLRYLEKGAVRAGGGQNHRMGLDDAVLIKENHLFVAGGITEAVNRARDRVGPTVKIEVETETLQQVQEAVEAGADIIMLDNMPVKKMREAVQLVTGSAMVEASGGMTPESIAEVAACGVDLISMGYLTHSAAPVDFSMNVIDVFKSQGG